MTKWQIKLVIESYQILDFVGFRSSPQVIVMFEVNGQYKRSQWLFFSTPLCLTSNTIKYRNQRCPQQTGRYRIVPTPRDSNTWLVFTKPGTINSPVDCKTKCIPANWLISFSAVDFPLDGCPMAVGTWQEPKNCS